MHVTLTVIIVDFLHFLLVIAVVFIRENAYD